MRTRRISNKVWINPVPLDRRRKWLIVQWDSDKAQTSNLGGTIVILRINYKLLIYRLALVNRIPSYLPLSDKKSIYGETALLLLLLQRWNFPCKHVSLMHIFGIHFFTINLCSHHCTVYASIHLRTIWLCFVTHFRLYRRENVFAFFGYKTLFNQSSGEKSSALCILRKNKIALHEITRYFKLFWKI